jgi:hypothetical protein
MVSLCLRALGLIFCDFTLVWEKQQKCHLSVQVSQLCEHSLTCHCLCMLRNRLHRVQNYVFLIVYHLPLIFPHFNGSVKKIPMWSVSLLVKLNDKYKMFVYLFSAHNFLINNTGILKILCECWCVKFFGSLLYYPCVIPFEDNNYDFRLLPVFLCVAGSLCVCRLQFAWHHCECWVLGCDPGFLWTWSR